MFLPGCSVYNAYEEQGRKIYWKQIKKGLFCHGIDAWWCDNSEPLTPEWNHINRVESSVQYTEYCKTAAIHLPVEETNAYALYHARAIYEGQRAESEKRVLNLTRSAYTGQQRYGTDCRRELWHIANSDVLFYDALLAINKLRYELIPYIYSYAGLSWLENGSMMRLLAFAYPKDRKCGILRTSICLVMS